MQGLTPIDKELIIMEYKEQGRAAAIKYIRQVLECGLRQGIQVFDAVMQEAGINVVALEMYRASGPII